MDFVPVFIQFRSEDGLHVEANGTSDVLVVDDMPAHWIEQLQKWTNFSDQIG